jgi:hypothetical protein
MSDDGMPKDSDVREHAGATEADLALVGKSDHFSGSTSLLPKSMTC